MSIPTVLIWSFFREFTPPHQNFNLHKNPLYYLGDIKYNKIGDKNEIQICNF